MNRFELLRKCLEDKRTVLEIKLQFEIKKENPNEYKIQFLEGQIFALSVAITESISFEYCESEV